MEQMYRENILDHYKHPHNYGTLDDAITHKESNPLCGDEIEVFMHIVTNKITEIKFQGYGCAISIAAMSILSDYVKGKTVEEVWKIVPEEIIDLLGIDVGVVRSNCALLGLKAVQKNLEKENEIRN
jgi:nitrogen fixation protein NifU and related proteins